MTSEGEISSKQSHDVEVWDWDPCQSFGLEMICIDVIVDFALAIWLGVRSRRRLG